MKREKGQELRELYGACDKLLPGKEETQNHEKGKGQWNWGSYMYVCMYVMSFYLKRKRHRTRKRKKKKGNWGSYMYVCDELLPGKGRKKDKGRDTEPWKLKRAVELRELYGACDELSPRKEETPNHEKGKGQGNWRSYMVHVMSYNLERKRHRTMKRDKSSGTEGAIWCMWWAIT